VAGLLEVLQSPVEETPDRNTFFFRGIPSSLHYFHEEQKFEFEREIRNLIKAINY
jgi:hypothetical protein